ncbi:MAG TPA: hypothetical protein VIL97_11235 [Thermoanaerobaculia bacterium]
MTDLDTAGKTLVFDRTPVARIVSCAAMFGAGALFFDYLSRGLDNVRLFPLLGLALLVFGTILATLLQYGDHIYVGPEGLLYRNRWFAMFGGAQRWLRWEEIVEVREIRRKILILLSNDGRRILVDAIAGYAIARREILRRTPHAVISGTLTKEDRGGFRSS